MISGSGRRRHRTSRPAIDRTFASDEACGAFRYLGGGAHFARVCLRV